MTKKTYGDIRLWNGDCMDLMQGKTDNYWDLAIVDPEYGGKQHGGTNRSGYVKQSNGKKLFVKDGNYKKKSWDNKPAGKEYFDELVRVSKNQIVWGVNNYEVNLGKGRIVWDKLNDNSDQYDCEIAYQSFDKRVDIVRYMWRGMMQGLRIGKGYDKARIQQGNKKLNEKRIHPTQKPVKLYSYLLQKYAYKGEFILDTHGGSMSLAISCHDEGFELDSIEIDKEYYDDAINRFEDHISQKQLF